MDTVELNIQLSPKDPWSDIVIAELSEHGFDSFVTTDEGVLAYAPISINTDEVVKESFSLNHLTRYSTRAQNFGVNFVGIILQLNEHHQ